MRSFAIVLLSCALGGGCARGQAGQEAGTLARRLLADSSAHWRTVSVPGARLHLAPGDILDRDAATIAGAGEVMISSATQELAAGTKLKLEDRGSHELKGLSGARRVFRLVRDP